jgi:N utilization substance protein A
LSLAIGKEGQNARLSARLSGWRVDIKSETQLAEEESRYGEEWAEGEWVENEAGEMVWQPAEGGEAVSATEWSRVVAGDDDGAATDSGPLKPDDSVEPPPPAPASASEEQTAEESGDVAPVAAAADLEASPTAEDPAERTGAEAEGGSA